jgi:hypothetical protein
MLGFDSSDPNQNQTCRQGLKPGNQNASSHTPSTNPRRRTEVPRRWWREESSKMEWSPTQRPTILKWAHHAGSCCSHDTYASCSSPRSAHRLLARGSTREWKEGNIATHVHITEAQGDQLDSQCFILWEGQLGSSPDLWTDLAVVKPNGRRTTAQRICSNDVRRGRSSPIEKTIPSWPRHACEVLRIKVDVWVAAQSAPLIPTRLIPFIYRATGLLRTLFRRTLVVPA